MLKWKLAIFMRVLEERENREEIDYDVLIEDYKDLAKEEKDIIKKKIKTKKSKLKAK